jgi:hypothetical protein
LPTNAEAARQFLKIQNEYYLVTGCQQSINDYAEALFEIPKNTPLGIIWAQKNAMDTAQREIDELRAQGGDGAPIDFKLSLTFRALAEEARQFHELLRFSGKTPDESRAIQVARRFHGKTPDEAHKVLRGTIKRQGSRRTRQPGVASTSACKTRSSGISS